MKKIKLREIIHNIVYRIEKDGGFSHLLINHEVSRHQLSEKDKALLTNLVYGTIQHKLVLDYYLSPFIKGKNVEDWVLTLLRTAIYQMFFLDRIPHHAILYESVEIAKRKGHKGTASFVNGVLRNIQRQGIPSTDSIEDKRKRISVETSHPEWLINYWMDTYGENLTEEMAKTNITQKPQSIRIQSMKTSREDIIKKLAKLNIVAKRSPITKHGLIIEKGNILETSLLKDGLVTIQDQSSILVSELMQIKETMIVLDACSAPGGKTTHIAELLHNTGEVYAYDIQKNKLKLIEQNVKRLGLSNVFINQADARKLTEKHEEKSFDRILLDVPCSGLGVLRSKPDIKYNKDQTDIKNLSTIQNHILSSTSKLLKEAGKLIYSTCTVTKEENEEIIEQFLNQNNHFKVDESFFEELPKELKNSPGISKYGIQIFPQLYNTDGFFITRLIRK